MGVYFFSDLEGAVSEFPNGSAFGVEHPFSFAQFVPQSLQVFIVAVDGAIQLSYALQ